MYTNATYWTLWHPLSYGTIGIGKFVIDSTFVTLQFSSFPSFLKFHSHTFIQNFLSQDRHLNSSYVIELEEDTKDEKSRTSFRSRTAGSSLSIQKRDLTFVLGPPPCAGVLFLGERDAA